MRRAGAESVSRAPSTPAPRGSPLNPGVSLPSPSPPFSHFFRTFLPPRLFLASRNPASSGTRGGVCGGQVWSLYVGGGGPLE